MLNRYDPFQDLFRVPFTLLNSGLSSAPNRDASGETTPARVGFIPNVDVHETDDAVMFIAELPGVNEEDIEIEVEKNILTLKGERRWTHTDKSDETEGHWIRSESGYGSFERRFKLPDTVRADDASADLKNGVLTLTFHKTADVKPKKIAIGVGA